MNNDLDVRNAFKRFLDALRKSLTDRCIPSIYGKGRTGTYGGREDIRREFHELRDQYQSARRGPL